MTFAQKQKSENYKRFDEKLIHFGFMLGANTSSYAVFQVQAAYSKYGLKSITSKAIPGGQVGIVGHITIGNNVRIQAQSGIGRNVKDNEILQGSPALSYGDYNKSYVYFKNLPKIVKQLDNLEKKAKYND